MNIVRVRLNGTSMDVETGDSYVSLTERIWSDFADHGDETITERYLTSLDKTEVKALLKVLTKAVKTMKEPKRG